MKKLKLLVLLFLSAFCVTGCDLSQFISINDTTSQNDGSNNQPGEGTEDEGSKTEEGGDNTGDDTGDDTGGGGSGGGGDSGGGGIITEGYYKGIDESLSGDDLLNQLRELNKQKRKNEVGYKQMGTTPSGKFKYTDYDPDTIRYDENGQPYGTRLISFYSGNSAADGMNREHVWPQTHGGTSVEDDIHMPRPTITSENGSRGHSFYIEGMKHSQNGWDPAQESFGKEDYRGDCARIVFYCMVATKNLTLTDDASRSSKTSNNEMGVISDMLSWNLRYPVQKREERRNSGAEYLQGNRNPFIDHPEYACKIWGSYNPATKQICGGDK